jgi:serine/threonine-protein kinase
VPSPVDKVDQYIRDFDGGDCFLALPTALTASSADIDAFGMNRKIFETFDEAFSKAQGFEAAIDAGQVTQGQCAVLRFVTELRRSAKAKAGRLEIARTAVRSGEVQTGSLVTEQATAVLLVVDDEGRITDVSKQLAPASSGKRFNVRLDASRPGQAQPVILLALASKQPLTALRDGATLTQASLSAAVREAAGQGGDLSVAAKYFKIE